MSTNDKPFFLNSQDLTCDWTPIISYTCTNFFQHITINIDETYTKCGGENVLVGNIINVHLFFMGPNSLKCTKILSQCHFLISFLPSHFLPCKETFIDDYDGS
jgi:hypothetical protein